MLVFNAVRKLALFLGITCSDDLIREISDKCNFQKMKDDKDNHIPEEVRKTLYKKNFSMFRKVRSEVLFFLRPPHQMPYHTYLTKRRTVGDWKNTFTVAQNEYFESMFLEKMKNSKLLLRYT
ncbi:hypothetical protein CHS0354_028904 [Potamilus streckersoni]|uniref:Sulfotransferase domain-containing protein n=1 Tax=Potamilus streckersoni TaxID=2493646 RepID=A0AAE0SBK4_9BIVA|nr:hypothetical protein CHS0354_028904 [Potamilus streckersoni]